MSIRKISNGLSQVLAKLSPHHCPLCEARAENGYLCDTCCSKLEANHSPCSLCGVPMALSKARICGDCLAQKPVFDNVVAPSIYDRNFADALAVFKNSGKLRCGRQLSKPLLDTLRTEQAQERVDTIVPVPSHWQTTLRRGFNPALEIAKTLTSELQIPLSEALIKEERTQNQKSMRKKDRYSNLKGAFALRVKPFKPMARVALVDDVMTTGATASICSSLLLSVGASYIEIWALARTPKN